MAAAAAAVALPAWAPSPLAVAAEGPQPGTIVTVAGGGVDDGAPATEALLMQPGKIAFAKNGDLLICDPAAGRVRLVHQGVMTTFAGTGDSGSTGDGGPARAAQVGTPDGVAVAVDGSVYISDEHNGTIRVVDSGGVIRTFAADLKGPAGLALDSAGALYVAEADGNMVVKIAASGGAPTPVAGTGVPAYNGDGIPASAAALDGPRDVAVDPKGNVYIADTANNRVRKVDVSGAIPTISTVLPQPGGVTAAAAPYYVAADTSSVDAPEVVVTDASGSVWVGDTQNSRVLKVTGSSAYTYMTFPVLSEYGGSIPVRGIAFGHEGDIYITADYRVYRSVHRFPFAGGPLRFDDAANLDWFGAPSNPSHYSNYPYYTPYVDPIDGQPATNAHLPMPVGTMAVDASGQLVLPTSTMVRRLSTSGVITTVAGTGAYPHVDPQNPDGFGYGRRWSRNGQPALAAKVAPLATTADASGNVYFADWATQRVEEIDTRGVIHDVAGSGLSGRGPGVAPNMGDEGEAATSFGLNEPTGLLVAPNGDVYIADTDEGSSARVLRVRHGLITTVAGTPATGAGAPIQQQVQQQHQVSVCLNFGEPTPSAINGDGGPAVGACLLDPVGLALDSAGNLYIADSGDNRVRRVDQHGIISTFAGNGSTTVVSGRWIPGFIGDGLPATEASLDHPGGVAVDTAGNVFIADSGNHVIREVDHSTGIISTVAGSILTGAAANAVGQNCVPPIGLVFAGICTVTGQGLGDPTGVTAVPARGDGGPAANAFMVTPWALALDARGDLFIGDIGDGRIREVYGLGVMHHTARPAPERERGSIRW